MTENHKSVRAPIVVDATPLMVTADVEPLVHANAGELLDLLTGEFFDDFMEIAQGKPGDKYAFEELQARLVERMSTRVSLTGPEAMRVAGRMAKLGKPLADLSAKTAAVVMKARGAREIKRPAVLVLPGQRSEGSAA